MSKYIIFVEQHILNRIAGIEDYKINKHETSKAIYYAIDSKFHKEWIKDMKDNLTNHEKKKMTRKEAIAAFRRHMPDAVNADKVVDFYIEAGMLEIVEEERSPNAIFCEIALKFTIADKYLIFMDEIRKAGLKITKA